ncbi:MAG TPA: hypothetical protein VLF14_00795 [Candidatus Binatia bacterium]|nr:hypothetical protein [Candidatus Binatia bacterium]
MRERASLVLVALAIRARAAARRGDFVCPMTEDWVEDEMALK